MTGAEDVLVPSSAGPGARIFLRIRRAARGRGAPKPAILFIHGATVSGFVFDLDSAGASWLVGATAAGFDAAYLDLRGYGRSTRPPEMGKPSPEGSPFCRAADAAHDVDDAIGFLRRTLGVEKVHIVALSWGTIIAGIYLASGSRPVERLAMVAPSFVNPNRAALIEIADPADPSRFDARKGAWRLATAAGIEARWCQQIVGRDMDDWRDRAVGAAFLDAFSASDPDAATLDPPGVRVPNGVLVDAVEVYNGRPLYDPSRLRLPTLVVRGAEDPESTPLDAAGLFSLLGSREKHYLVIGRATHFAIVERAGPRLLGEVLRFLDPSANGG